MGRRDAAIHLLAFHTRIQSARCGDLREYLERLRREPPGRPTPERHLEIFEGAFGDIDRLERVWTRYERTAD